MSIGGKYSNTKIKSREILFWFRSNVFTCEQSQIVSMNKNREKYENKSMNSLNDSRVLAEQQKVFITASCTTNAQTFIRIESRHQKKLSLRFKSQFSTINLLNIDSFSKNHSNSKENRRC